MTGLHSLSDGLHTSDGKKPDDDIVMEEREGPRHGRVYKKSNWTLTELQVLQTAKREDQEKQLKADPKEKHKSAAERWQWIEDYCWDQRVERSAQQCRDRWERMSADFKKVGDFEKQVPRGGTSYWQMTIDDRKTKKLPSNFQQEIFHALGEWFVRSRAVDPNDIVIDTSVPSPLQVNNACVNLVSNGDNSSSEEGESDPQDGPTTCKKRKLPPGVNAEGIAAIIERANMATQRTMLECEDRKDRRHKETLEANERIASGYISALVSIADALRQFATNRDDRE
ncbi:protein MpTRIHELIX25 [Marchantia polymorpha subsp. ruderalis]|uniref:Myb-like domain-containing protein n=2 Tax=Marchantia polymorpha TaxID=3197 RepID=A0AAF6AKY3_MARPO|nr:hypothetical protein MARPO_0113s0052 [Marchantia polymorpha]PTQ31327.1 hypothetical protein MARPO_0113s0053 [Marchantia polymorpha]BBM97103.1 hypothetical protein Mp_1g03040 [Marchantia polymorpha subsp. ruderalis]BBM97104.1 hypothetical protein Mp_1g03050 [Marchantia polymorpha subsp. ruderalis]|eukprot:PTQ31326.1 hypothetical protein MARPO_0113s0052 [Marchantia polymorpha]